MVDKTNRITESQTKSKSFSDFSFIYIYTSIYRIYKENMDVRIFFEISISFFLFCSFILIDVSNVRFIQNHRQRCALDDDDDDIRSHNDEQTFSHFP